MFDVVLALHVSGGIVALLSGPVPMFSRKGGTLHRRAGRVYAAAMALTCVAGLALAIIVKSVLLLVIAVFSGFLVFSGVRALAFLRRATPSSVDTAACVLTALFSLGLLAHAIAARNVTELFFGVAGCVLAGRRLRRQKSDKTDWLVEHLASMGAAYIATSTAFVVVNLSFLPQAVVFIAPTLIGTPLIAWAASWHAPAPIGSRRHRGSSLRTARR